MMVEIMHQRLDILTWIASIGVLCSLGPVVARTTAQSITAFRPPAVPLVTCDPYFSIWSMSDRLTDDWPRHWTGSVYALDAMVRIDGKTYRVMCKEPGAVPAMPQAGLRILPTRTVYEFEAEGVHLTFSFF